MDREPGCLVSRDGGQTQNSRYMGTSWTYTRRTESRASVVTEDTVWAIVGGAASGLENCDDTCAPRPQGIQCYNCELLGHTVVVLEGKGEI